jgi:hypothetical protein
MRPASGSPGDATSSETAFKYVYCIRPASIHRFAWQPADFSGCTPWNHDRIHDPGQQWRYSEVKKGRTYVWLVFGMDAITVYVFSELLSSTLYAIDVRTGTKTVSLSWHMFVHCFAEIPSHHLASLAYSISIVVVCFIPVAILYRKKIFLKV